VNRTEFQELSRLRLAEASALLAGNQASGAYYLAGYAVECALKACIAKQTQAEDFPLSPEEARNVYVHDLKRLVKAADLETELASEQSRSATFGRYWTTTVKWDEASRYSVWSLADANGLLRAIDDPTEGVMQWLQRHW